MEQEAEQERECPGCGGEGVIYYMRVPDNRCRICPVCDGHTVIAASRKVYLICNPLLLDSENFLAIFENGSKEVSLRFPDDYVCLMAVEAENVRMACELAWNQGATFLPFTVVVQPDGTRWGYPAGHEILEH
jgi:hypothetical protein